MWDIEKIDSQNIEFQETKNIVRHPEVLEHPYGKSVVCFQLLCP